MVFDRAAATASVQLIVSQATPTITWATPAGIIYGTVLSGAQLNATTAVAGSFVYTPAAGSTPLAGTDTLSVVFTPTDTSNYTTATKSVQIVVTQATPVITWATESKKSLVLSDFDEISMGETFYLRPRMSAQVTCSDCP